MESTEAPVRHVIVTQAVRGLIARVQSERARMLADSSEHEFYLGVEAALKDTLQPERADAKPADWLERESPAFCRGHARASRLVAAAATAEPPPVILQLPAFEHGD